MGIVSANDPVSRYCCKSCGEHFYVPACGNLGTGDVDNCLKCGKKIGNIDDKSYNKPNDNTERIDKSPLTWAKLIEIEKNNI